MAGTLAAVLGGELEDPTRPAARPPVHAEIENETETSKLRSIRISPDDRVAVIDGRPVRIGDRVGDAVVVAIDLAGVRLQDARGEILLTLYGGSFQRSSPRNRSSK
jgi:MSHA biogenesis protein MshK